MKTNQHFLIGLLMLLLFVAIATGQQPQASPKPAATPTTAAQDPNQDKAEIIFIRRVRLPITVMDKKGQLVSGLTQGDFLVFEDKVAQTIDSFTSDENNKEVLNVAVLMDTSPSTAGKLKFEQEAAKNFVYTVARPRKDRVLFATFDDTVTLRQDFTDRPDLLSKAIDSVKKPGSQTALYDAIWEFCDEKMRTASGRRVVVVITDGDDTYSRATINDAIDIAQRTETILFAISTKAGFMGSVPGVDAGQAVDKRDKDLVRLCEETGGAAFFTGDMVALERSFTKIANELRSQYLITYKPSNDRYDGSVRKIEVKLVNGNERLRLRTKTGYKAVRDGVTVR